MTPAPKIRRLKSVEAPGRVVLDLAAQVWNNLLRGGASLLLRSGEKSFRDWNGGKGRELNSQDQPPRTRCARAVVKHAQLGGAENAFRRNRRFR